MKGQGSIASSAGSGVVGVNRPSMMVDVWRAKDSRPLAFHRFKAGRCLLEVNFRDQVGDDFDLGKLLLAVDDFAAADFELCQERSDV